MLIADYIRTDYDKFLGTFYVQNLRLIQTLEEMNKEKMEEVERNNKLISLLKEVNDEYAGKRR